MISEDKKTKYHVMSTAFTTINWDLKKSTIDVNYSGTTCVSVILYGWKLVCANVGDSRAVLGSLKTISDATKIDVQMKELWKR